MRLFPDHKLGLRTALVAIVVGGIVLSAAALHLVWWRTATSVSRELVDVLETQITQARAPGLVGRGRRGRAAVAGHARPARRGPEQDQAERIIVAASRPSAIAFLAAAGAARRRRDRDPEPVRRGAPPALRMDEDGALRAMAPSHGRMPRPHRCRRRHPAVAHPRRTLAGDGAGVRPTRSGSMSSARPTAPAGRSPSSAGPAPGMLAAMIDYDRFARLLGSIAGRPHRRLVRGRAARAAVVIAPIADERTWRPSWRRWRSRRRPAGRRPPGRRSEHRGAGPARGRWRRLRGRPSRPCGSRAGSSRSSCPRPSSWPRSTAPSAAWRSASPCSLLAVGCLVAIGARRFLADPVARVAEDLAQIERFELEAIPHRPSRLVEIDRLRRRLVRMAAGLADFAKFIPTELVRRCCQRRARRARRRAARADRPVRRPRRLHRPERAPGRPAWSRSSASSWSWPPRRSRPRAARSTSSSATRSWPSGARRPPTPTRRCTPAAPHWRSQPACAPPSPRRAFGRAAGADRPAHRPGHRRQCRLHPPPQLHGPGRHGEPRLAAGRGEQGLWHDDPDVGRHQERADGAMRTREIDTVAVYGRSEGVRCLSSRGRRITRSNPTMSVTAKRWPYTSKPASPRPCGRFPIRASMTARAAGSPPAVGGYVAKPPSRGWQPITHLDMK